MKNSAIYILLIYALFSLLMSPACSTTEEQAIVYDITGTWVFSCQWSPGPQETIMFMFTGALTNGLSNDLTHGYTGVYTVNNTAVEVVTNHTTVMCGTITDIYTGVFTSPASMSGSHLRTHSGPCTMGSTMTWTATKL